MATGMTSWGQRKALGKRYAVDPALLLEQERLQNEYNLAPSREARALQADQFNRQLAFNAEQAEQNRSDAAKSGMMGTVGGIAQNAAILRAMTMEKGQPFFGGLFGGGTSAPAAGVTGTYSTGAAVAPTATGIGGNAPVFTGGMTQTVNPALMDTALTASEAGGAVGTASGATGTGMAGTTAGTGSGFSVGSVAGPVAIIAGALAAKNQWGGKDIPWDEKTTMQKATTAPGTAVALLPLAVGDKIFGGDSVFGKAYKEMARIEEQVMKPIEAVLDWIGDWF